MTDTAMFDAMTPSEQADILKTVDALRDPQAAIKFALSLDAFETAHFLKDWQKGEDLCGWVTGVLHDKKFASEQAA